VVVFSPASGADAAESDDAGGVSAGVETCGAGPLAHLTNKTDEARMPIAVPTEATEKKGIAVLIGAS